MSTPHTETDAEATLARTVGGFVGGPENVATVHNCTTRLRFVVHDDSKVDFAGLDATPGVLQAVKAGGQVQVVIGTHVERIRDKLVAQPEWRAFDDAASPHGEERALPEADGGEKRRPLDAVFDFLGATFQPLIPAITGAALVQVVVLLITQFGWVDADSAAAGILTAAGNAVFYFLPIFAAFTASRKLGANPFIGAVIAAALLHPSFTSLGEQGTQIQAFGLPLFLYSYASSMFPALLLALALGGFDRLLKRVLPRALQQVFVPTIELLVLVPLTALVFGPIGVIVGNGLGQGLAWLSTNAPFVFYVVVPALWIFMVAMGIHWALISIGLAEIAAGSSIILGASFGYTYAMFGVALGMLILAARQRNKSLRNTATAATISVGIGGITEPTLYGLILPYRRVLVIEMISAGASGLVLGVFNTSALAFSPAPILALPLLVPFAGGVLALVVGLVVPTVLLQLWGYEKRRKGGDAGGGRNAEAAADDTVTAETVAAAANAAGAPIAAETASASAQPTETSSSQSAGGGFRGIPEPAVRTTTTTIAAPLAGAAVPLSEVPDPIFAGELIGPGVAIRPSGGRVVAPAAGEIVAAPPSGHAIGIRTDDGVEVLIHVGIDTVKLGGEHFTPRVAQGDRVEAGQLMLEFDAAAITAAGYPLITPVLVTNLGDEERIGFTAAGEVAEGDPLLRITPAS